MYTLQDFSIERKELNKNKQIHRYSEISCPDIFEQKCIKRMYIVPVLTRICISTQLQNNP